MSTAKESHGRSEPVLAAPSSTPLTDAQSESWSQGHRIPVEHFIQSAPALPSGQIVLDLIYNEHLIRQDLGERPCLEEYQIRFPDLTESLTRMFEVHQLVETFSLEDHLADTESAADTEPTIEANDRSSGTPSNDPIAGYELLEMIGRGGTGIVHLARQHRTNRIVAIKMLHGAAIDSNRFSIEAQAMARLRHPSIVPVHEAGIRGGIPFLVMDFIDGESLASRIERKTLDPQSTARLIQSVALAIDYAHSRNVIHRDLKPQNILIDQSGQPQIVDFGLARFNDRQSKCTTSGEVLGTIPYMSPEQASGTSLAIGATTDVYGIGAVMYHTLTGHAPHEETSIPKLIESVLHLDPRHPESIVQGIPTDLSTICMKCLQKEIADRYRSAADLADDLQRFLDGRPVAARPLPMAIRAWRLARRRPRISSLIAGTIVLTLLMLLGATWAAWKFRADGQEIRETLVRAEYAEGKSRSALIESKILQAQMSHQSRREGQRYDTLETIDAARALASGTSQQSEVAKRLRDQLTATLSVPDVRQEAWQPFIAVESFAELPDQVESKRVGDFRISFRAGHTSFRIDRHKSERRYPAPIEVHTESPSTDSDSTGWRSVGPTSIDRDGRWFAAAVTGDSSSTVDADGDDKFQLFVWDLQEPGQEPSAYAIGDRNPIEVMFCESKGTFVVATGDQFLIVGPERGYLETVPGDGAISGCCIHPSQARVAVWDDCSLRMVDLTQNEPTQSTQSHATFEILSADWHPDGSLLAVGSADHLAYMFYADELDQPAMTFYGAQGWINQVRFAHDGTLMASCNSEERSRLYDIGTGQCVLCFEGIGREFGPSSESIEGSRFGLPSRWHIDLPEIHWTLWRDRNANVASAGDTNNNGQMALCGWTEINLWDTSSRTRLASVPSDAPQSVRFVADDQIVVLDANGVRQFKITHTGNHLELIEGELRFPDIDPRSIDVIEDRLGPKVAIVTNDQAQIYEIGSGRVHDSKTVPIGMSERAELSPDGRYVASLSTDRTMLNLFDVDSAKLQIRIPTQARNPRFCFDDQSTRLVVGGGKHYQVVETGTWATVAGIAYPSPSAVRGGVCFSPDGELIAISHQRDVIDIVNARNGTFLVELPVPQNGTWLHFTPDGSTLLSRDANYRLRAWDLNRLQHASARHKLGW